VDSFYLYLLYLSYNTSSLPASRNMPQLDTDQTDVNELSDINDESDEDEAWLLPNEDHPPEYYLQQLEIFNEQEYAKEDYKDSSTRLLNRMEDQWNQYVSLSP